jgi:hypothetical protein
VNQSERQELEEHRAEFRALQDRVARLAAGIPLDVTTDDVEERIAAEREVEVWESVMRGGAGQ